MKLEFQTVSQLAAWIYQPDGTSKPLTQGMKTIQNPEYANQVTNDTPRWTMESFREYTFDKIIWHVIREEGLRNVMRNYGYAARMIGKNRQKTYDSNLSIGIGRAKPIKRTPDESDNEILYARNGSHCGGTSRKE